MKKFKNRFFNDDPEFEHLIYFCGALVPIAHIKMIGEVKEDFMEVTDAYSDEKIPCFGFAVMLTDSVHFSDPTENPQMLYADWETREEAEEQRLNLALQVDNYYERLLKD